MSLTKNVSMSKAEILEKNFGSENDGYKRSLKRRHAQMIAIGGCIGSGLFLGSANTLHTVGPATIISYIIAGLIALVVMLAVGDLVVHRATPSAFVSYSREFFGDRAGFSVGWVYWFHWLVVGAADISAVGSYTKGIFGDKTWPGSLAAFCVVLSVNLLSVRAFGELEFFASLIKVTAIVIFIVICAVLVLGQVNLGEYHAGIGNLFHATPAESGWFVPLLLLNSVIFAYSDIELIAVAAGEMKNAAVEIRRAVNGVIFRIVFFYLGTIFLLCVVLPTNVYTPGTSPLVTVAKHFSNQVIGNIAPGIIIFVLVTAAVSAMNSGIYASGRTLKALSARKQAPAFVNKINSKGIPHIAIISISVVLFFAIIANYFFQPSSGDNPVFDIATELSAFASMVIWISILACQLKLRKFTKKGIIKDVEIRTPFYPYASIIGITAIVLIFLSTAIGVGASPGINRNQMAMLVVPVIAIALFIGWKVVKPKVIEATGNNIGPVWVDSND